MTDPTPKGEEEIARELRLRTPPPPVTRLSRKVLVGGAAAAALVIGGAAWWALEGSKAGPKKPDELYSTIRPNPPDRLSQLPRDYSKPGAQIPKLGPPLPGDLGRPILAAQGGANSTGMEAATGQSGRPVPAVDPVRQQAEQAREAAKTSRLFASLGEGAAPAPATESPGLGLTSAAMTGPASETVSSAPAQDHRLALLAGGSERGPVNPARLAAPASPYLVQAGTLITAALITGVRSDLPGQITAQVTEDVHDSVTGRWLLIPQGSRLIGTYDSQVSFGQSRVLMAWTRLILPNGKSIELGRAPAADRFGFAGLQDGVDRHWRALFGAAALSTVLGIGSDLGSSSQNSDLVQALRRGSQETLNRAGEDAVRRQLDVQPTLTLRPGHAVRVVVERDLVLEPYEAEGSR